MPQNSPPPQGDPLLRPNLVGKMVFSSLFWTNCSGAPSGVCSPLHMTLSTNTSLVIDDTMQHDRGHERCPHISVALHMPQKNKDADAFQSSILVRMMTAKRVDQRNY